MTREGLICVLYYIRESRGQVAAYKRDQRVIEFDKPLFGRIEFYRM